LRRTSRGLADGPPPLGPILSPSYTGTAVNKLVPGHEEHHGAHESTDAHNPVSE
jgi:hypothetical protein